MKTSAYGWSVKLNAGIMENASLSLTEVWAAATRNTFADGETIIKSMTSVLAEMLGEPICEDFDLSMPQMYVNYTSNKNTPLTGCPVKGIHIKIKAFYIFLYVFYFFVNSICLHFNPNGSSCLFSILFLSG